MSAKSKADCPFCSVASDKVFYADELVLGLWDGFPVAPGHALLVPKRHVASWFDATVEERAALVAGIEAARREIERAHRPDGYNVGINVGAAAGQTVFHLHVHVIPRYAGDMEDPRGGVRYVIPDKARYWEPGDEEAAGNEPGSSGVGAPGAGTTTPFGVGLTDTPHQRHLVTGGDDELLPHLLAHLDHCRNVDVAVAFTKRSGLNQIESRLKDLLYKGGRIRFLTGDYLLSTEPAALAQLLDLADSPDSSGTFELRVFECHQIPFHPKAYIFHGDERQEGIAFVGSSNLSERALRDAVEWNYRIVSSSDTAAFAQVEGAFDELFAHPSTVEVTQEWIDAYRQRRDEVLADLAHGTGTAPPDAPPDASPGEGADIVVHDADGGAMPGEKPTRPATYPLPLDDEDLELPFGVARPEDLPTPHEIQSLALEALAQTRADGYKAGLIVLATGLGKTWLSAFDSIGNGFKRVLFVAHREEILDQARRTYRLIAPEARLGLYTGTEKRPDVDALFASIQTLGHEHHLRQFAPDQFDYIVVDEFHHAAAPTYRHLIDHFEPQFLLGLTATPERTDGGDLLALCQENLVYRCDLTEGIRRGLLAAFKYFGVPDLIDYEQIPWRGRRFDEEALTTHAATQARAENALEQLVKHGQSRTLGFCVSIPHADFMADFLAQRGLRAVAVHSGDTSSPRTASLEKLQRGDLDVVFAVDIFNEGVDLPSVDTILMLRPTESRIVWLQQFGRGLRVTEDKDHLAVIDYIGNHRNFLLKPQALLGLPSTDREVSLALQRLEAGELDLPPGCEVTYELEAKNILRSLIREPKGEESVRLRVDAFREQHDRRPTAVELWHEGFNPRVVRKASGSWFQFLASQELLDKDETAALEHCKEFCSQLERTPMTKSFKMLTLLGMLSRDAFPGEIPIDELARAVASIARRTPVLAKDVGKALDDPNELQKLLEINPIAAWTGGKGTGGHAYFAYEDGVFSSTLSVPSEYREAAQEMTRELVDWRLAEYLDRSSIVHRDTDIVCKVSHNGRHPILFLPSREAFPGIPSGWADVLVDGDPHQAKFAKIAVNVLQNEGSEENVLGEVLRGWFGENAGESGTRFQVAFREAEGTWLMEPADPAEESGPELWQTYRRDEIAGLFGLPYQENVWRQGFISLPGHLFLLVTLDKSDLADEYAYADRFLNDREFQWQSQNRTTQSGKHGQQIRHHAERGLQVHLFVRTEKKLGGKAAPFYYCGEVDFQKWDGEKPITVLWELREAVPKSLRAQFQMHLS
jgi:superfamily II DNA or RNA helicase/diadenosine tetraphosphate (Ap4A) HIT family hydrolase/HKD family nuclease